jgi:pSer/pThr/pTyr-binding forkhead associated (FHA) protein
MLAHISEPPPFPRQFNPDCPADLEKVILTAMEKSPDERYDTMQVMVNALKDVLASSKQRPAFYTAPPPPPTKIRSPSDALEMVDLTDVEAQPAPSEPVAPGDTRIFLVDQRVTIQVPDKDNLIIGRTHRQTVADIDLGPHGAAEVGVSRHHARLTRQSSGWQIDDLDSLNGTYVNDVKIKPGQPVPLKDGDLIRCSHISFIFLVTSKT